MSERAAFLSAIVADPDDDMRRLAFADWLDETGTDPDRAAFIRAQIEAAHSEPFSPKQRDANRRANELLFSNKHRWSAHLLRRTIDVTFVRGFIEEAVVDAARLPMDADEIFDAEPIRGLRVVRLLGENNPTLGEHARLEPLFELPRLRQLRRLDLQGVNLLPEEGYALSSSPHLVGLRELCLSGNPVSVDWIADLLAGKGFPRLTALDVSDIPHIGPALVRGLRRSSHRLRRLDISGVAALNSDQLSKLLATPALQSLEDLRMRWSDRPDPITPGPLAYLDLGWVLPWDRLRVLDLAGQYLGPEGVEELNRKREAASLRWLGLAFNGIGRAGAWSLAASERLNPFHLDVRGNDLTRRDVTKLRERFPDAEIVV